MAKKIAIILFLLLLAFCYYIISPIGNSKQVVTLIVPEDKTGFNVIKQLTDQKLIRYPQIFGLFYGKSTDIKSGGYYLTNSMNIFQIAKKLAESPDLVWITIAGCQRKEQIGEVLAKALGWSEAELTKWDTIYTNTKPEYFEGVYYPDTYLIPVKESGDLIAQRFINNFNEKFAPIADEFVAKNIKWTTALKIASLIAREGPNDKNLIAGIIWNRLDKNMRLQIDSTMQYTLGKQANGRWWGSIDLNQKLSESPYNTYLHEGLPPTPICSPNIDIIEAVANPTETKCLYYLHDSFSQIHCAATYAQHLKNIKKYLE